jgi:hypothetical protein
MFNGIFSQFVENPPKLWADQTEKPNSNRKIRPLWGDFVEEFLIAWWVLYIFNKQSTTQVGRNPGAAFQI